MNQRPRKLSVTPNVNRQKYSTANHNFSLLGPVVCSPPYKLNRLRKTGPVLQCNCLVMERISENLLTITSH
jgi:hypothetical protein